jgi:hypothetical protein
MERLIDNVFIDIVTSLALGIIGIAIVTSAVLLMAIGMCKVAVRLKILRAHLAKCTKTSKNTKKP